MRVIYNGIDLMAVETHEFFGESVYDDSGVDYLYTKYTIHVTGVINGQFPTGDFFTKLSNGTMNYGFVGTGPVGRAADALAAVLRPELPPRTPTPVAPPNASLTYPAPLGVAPHANPTTRAVTMGDSTPPLTHEAIRHRLETPRGQLYVFSGIGMEGGVPAVGSSLPPAGQMILQSPTTGYVCDVKNGPIPKLLAVTMSVGGTNTMFVDWTCETYVNEAKTNNVDPSGIVLSNRFRQTHVINKVGFTTIVTNGVAIFRTDRLTDPTPGRAINPDSLRARLFIPIQQGFVRTVDAVEGRPDVSGIEYQYTDTQVPVNFVAGPYCRAADISAVHRQAIVSDANPIGDILGAVERGTSLMLNAKWLADSLKGAPKKTPPLPARVRTPGTPHTRMG